MGSALGQLLPGQAALDPETARSEATRQSGLAAVKEPKLKTARCSLSCTPDRDQSVFRKSLLKDRCGGL